MNFPDFFAYVLVFAKILLIIVSFVIFFSGLDDFFIDIVYLWRTLRRKFFIRSKHPKLTVDHLLLPKEQPIAIMVPAWDESAVIRHMLENTLKILNYSNYHVFVGTYPNDPETNSEVEQIREHFDNVHRIVTPKDGPTNKADCLNWIYQGIRLFEEQNNIEFQIFVMDDCEDILHPLYLKLFNYLIPRKDMVQVPVFPLEIEWYRFTGGHYLDEFSELHSKDMLVREKIAGGIPSAGVGTAFSRRALMAMAETSSNQLFSVDSLTEDYEFGIRLAHQGFKGILVKQFIERTVRKKSFWTGKIRDVQVKEFIGVWELFPTKFYAAVPQKSRWILGIALQGWKNLGWKGTFGTKYMFFRDRKGLVTNAANAAAYLTVLILLPLWLLNKVFPDAYQYPTLIEKGSLFHTIIVLDTFFLFVRLIQRALLVFSVYGLKQAALSVPRQFWGNIINLSAVTRAVYLFIKGSVTGKVIQWDKTAHVFPNQSELLNFRRKMGDLLLEKRFITVKQLEEALQRQKEFKQPLGVILVSMGLVQEDDLIQVLGMQFQLTTREVDPYDTPIELLELLPRKTAVRYSVYPLEIQRNGRLLVASNDPLTPQEVEEIENRIERPIDVCLCTRSDIAFAIQRGYERLEGADLDSVPAADKSRLGNVLVELNVITPEQLQKALRVQRRSYARLGEILLDEGMLTQSQLDQALAQFENFPKGHFGGFLVQAGYLNLMQLDKALQLQTGRFRRLGDVLVDMGFITERMLEQIVDDASLEKREDVHQLLRKVV